jgi:hypothetical protein
MRDGESSLTEQATRLTDVLICVDCGGGLRAEGSELHPLAAVLFATIVLPYRFIRRVPRLERVADALP